MLIISFNRAFAYVCIVILSATITHTGKREHIKSSLRYHIQEDLVIIVRALCMFGKWRLLPIHFIIISLSEEGNSFPSLKLSHSGRVN